jgi:glyoxylase-like metal-dependent hydrolase (beta-lactamase superfamily II)
MLTFQSEKITPRITRIFGFCGELMYLVEGDVRAALIDTGSGFGSLKGCVDALTDKPLVVLITHGHIDHAMGASEFKDVYMSHKDFYIFDVHGKEEGRKMGLSMSSLGDKITDEDFIPTADKSLFQDLRHGDVFDLGGVTVEMFECPGHTLGTLTMLIREERLLLLGDACNPRTFLFGGYSTGIETYRKSLIALKAATDGKYDNALLSHGHRPGEQAPDFSGMIESGIGVCADILKGNVDDVPFSFMGRTDGVVAKATDVVGRRVDGGLANIVYDKSKIRE